MHSGVKCSCKDKKGSICTKHLVCLMQAAIHYSAGTRGLPSRCLEHCSLKKKIVQEIIQIQTRVRFWELLKGSTVIESEVKKYWLEKESRYQIMAFSWQAGENSSVLQREDVGSEHSKREQRWQILSYQLTDVQTTLLATSLDCNYLFNSFYQHPADWMSLKPRKTTGSPQYIKNHQTKLYQEPIFYSISFECLACFEGQNAFGKDLALSGSL